MIHLDDIGEFDWNGSGAQAEGTRARLAQSWWAQRFVSVVESAAAKPALDHGRRYARKGQVISMLVNSGEILARVQGTQPTPYVCRLKGSVCDYEQWRTICETLVRTSEHVCGLLASQIPRGLEKVVADAGGQLFPESFADLDCVCTCEDGNMPCKHVIAAACVFADRLDTEPGLLLEWRGRSLPEITGALRASWGAPAEITQVEDRQDTVLGDMDIATFYQLSPAVDAMPPMALAPQYPDVMKRLGFPPFFPPGDRTVQQVLNNLYDES